jgi:hypothetical protein
MLTKWNGNDYISWEPFPLHSTDVEDDPGQTRMLPISKNENRIGKDVKQFWYTQFESKMLWNIAKLCSNHLNTQTMSLEPILTWECHDLLATRYAEACYSQTGMVSLYSLSLADRESQVPLDTRSLLTSALGIRNKFYYVPRRGVVKSRPVFSSGIDASSC